MLKSYLFFRIIYFRCILNVFAYNVDTNFPIVYSDPYPNKNRSTYYGFSLVLSDKWIQIGAPRANSSEIHSQIHEPGVTYHCKFNRSCVRLSLGKQIPEKNIFSPKSWFGSSMDYWSGPNEQIVVCAHRWMDESRKSIPGACISFQPSQDPTNIINLVAPTYSDVKEKKFVLKKGDIIGYNYAMSQVGTSVHFTHGNKNEAHLLLGAPGYRNWRGSVVKCDDLSSCTKNSSILNVQFYEEMQDFDLFGYQVSSGHFFSSNVSDVVYVAGTPRDISMKGHVRIFKFNSKNNLLNITKISGSQTGEYFGSSIAVADISGDGRDDLIIGAPFFSRFGDEGRICTIQFYEDTTEKKRQSIEGKKERGHFGTAIAAIGDIDNDGYQDIAIGAPYQGNGAVYIYYGSELGLINYQQILAKDVYPELRGFGISFFGHADVDGNKYKDIAVGSYLSGHAVVLRSLPVIKVEVQIESSLEQLPIHQSSIINITSCVVYTGIGAPKELNFKRRIIADISHKRVLPPFFEDTLTVKLGSKSCQNHEFNVTFKKNLDLQNVEFSLTSKLVASDISKTILKVQRDGKIPGEDHFHLQNPVQKMLEGTSSARIEIPFFRNCSKPICEPELQLYCSLLENEKLFNLKQPLIIGSNAKYQLIVDVTNIGEPAYSSQIEVKFSKEIHLSYVPHSCSQKEDVFICYLGPIIQKGRIKPLILDLDMLAIENINLMDNHTVQIEVNITTNAHDINLDNNYQKIVLSLKADVDVKIYGKSQKDIIPVMKQENGSFATALEIIHVHEIQKKGVSPLKSLELTLQIPNEIQHKKETIQFAYLQPPQVVFENAYWSCSNIDQHFQPDVFENPYTFETHSRFQRSVLENNLLSVTSPPSNRTFFINCTTDYVKCITISCQINYLQAYGKVTLIFSVDVGKLERVMGQKDIVYITSQGRVKIVRPRISSTANEEAKGSHISHASSIVIGKIPAKKVDLWIIVSSVVGGILLAMFLAMGLAKAGFFQRQKKEELQELKQKARDSQLQPETMCTDQDELNAAFELT